MFQLTDLRVESSNPGMVNKINHVSKGRSQNRKSVKTSCPNSKSSFWNNMRKGLEILFKVAHDIGKK